MPAGFYNLPITWSQGVGVTSIPDSGVLSRVRVEAGIERNLKEIGGVERWSLQIQLSASLTAQFVHLGSFALCAFVRGAQPDPFKACPNVASWGIQAWHPTYVRSFGPIAEPQLEVPTVFKYYTPCLDNVVGTAIDEDPRFLEFIIPNTEDDDVVTWSWLVAHKINGTLTRFRNTDADLTGCAYAMCEMDSLFLIFSNSLFTPITPQASFQLTASVSRAIGPKNIFTSMHIGGGVNLG